MTTLLTVCLAIDRSTCFKLPPASSQGGAHHPSSIQHCILRIIGQSPLRKSLKISTSRGILERRWALFVLLNLWKTRGFDLIFQKGNISSGLESSRRIHKNDDKPETNNYTIQNLTFLRMFFLWIVFTALIFFFGYCSLKTLLTRESYWFNWA